MNTFNNTYDPTVTFSPRRNAKAAAAAEANLRTLRHTLEEQNIHTVAALQKHKALYNDFQTALYTYIIADLAVGFKNSNAVDRLVRTYGGAGNDHLEFAHRAYISLFLKLKKGENKGRVRLDTFLDKPEALFIPTIAAFYSNAILKDPFKKAVHQSTDQTLTVDEDNPITLGDVIEDSACTADLIQEKYVRSTTIRVLMDLLSDPKDVIIYAYALENDGRLPAAQVAADLHTYGTAAVFEEALDKLEDAAGTALNKAFYRQKFCNFTRTDKLTNMETAKAAAAALSRSFDKIKPAVRTDPRLRALR